MFNNNTNIIVPIPHLLSLKWSLYDFHSSSYMIFIRTWSEKVGVAKNGRCRPKKMDTLSTKFPSCLKYMILQSEFLQRKNQVAMKSANFTKRANITEKCQFQKKWLLLSRNLRMWKPIWLLACVGTSDNLQKLFGKCVHFFRRQRPFLATPTFSLYARMNIM